MRRPLLSYKVIIGCMVSIAFLSYMVYGHHMFVSGMNPSSSIAFSFPTLIITIPATIIVLIWMGSLYKSRLRLTSASLFALGFISMFVTGGVSGFFLAQPSIDIMLHATYFVVGHFHFVMAVAAIFGIFSATYPTAQRLSPGGLALSKIASLPASRHNSRYAGRGWRPSAKASTLRCA